MQSKDFITNDNYRSRNDSLLSNLSDFYYHDGHTKSSKAQINGIELDKNTQETKLLGESEDKKNDLKGFCLLVFSVFMYSFANLISKYLSIFYPTIENLTVNLFRGLYLILISSALIYHQKIDYIEQIQRNNYKTKLLLIRCLFGAFANIALFEAFKYMRISSAFTIFCTYPIFVSVLSIIFFKSKFSNFDIVNYIACILSVVFISKPAFIFTDASGANDSAYGVFFAFSAAITNAIGVCINKSIAFDFDYLISTLLLGVFFVAESIVLLPFTQYGISTLSFKGFLWCTLLSIIFFIGLSMFVLALNYGNPVKILPATYFGIVFSLIYNTFIFGKPTDFLDILGSGTIVLFNTLGNCNIKFLWKKLFLINLIDKN